jgi:hypothetical protein
LVTGTKACPGSWFSGENSKASNVEVSIAVFRANTTVVFETEPTDALPDVFFENNLSLPITNGNHMGNIQNQNIGTNTPAIVDTEFFNCYAFGNGVESYKIRDSIIGHSFNLGNRVTSVSEQEYKRADRFADITYSGVFNPETNINRLNVFNLGLLNYKNLEVSFGPIQILDGRETDILVLQEDKISYVLAEKNIISDSTGGGAIASVPEILGTQVARIEKYGISFNPESYVQWGYDRFFTDAKRGAVIQLREDPKYRDQLVVVSELDMRTWFRDMFNSSFDTQKLGGYDPYMNEYVLVSNEIKLPKVEECLECGVTQTFKLDSLGTLKEKTYCVSLGKIVGTSSVAYTVNNIEEGSEFNIIVEYNGDTFESGLTSVSGEVTFDKDVIDDDTITITIQYEGVMSIDIHAGCVDAETLTVIQVVLTNDFESGQTVHAIYRYENGTYVSPAQASFVTFQEGTENPLVSEYRVFTDFVGSGAIPPAGSNMIMISSKYATDTFDFDPLSDKFRYLMSNTLYNNTPSDMTSLLGASSVASPNQGGGDYNYATFTVPALQDYLYLIWDFRTATPIEMCYSDIDANDVCCNCDPIPS